MPTPPSLVSTDWLEQNLSDPNVKVLDATWHFPNSGRNALAEYRKCHIPGAIFFDVDEIADLESNLPHMMPNNEKMASRVRTMGITNSNHIIVYDNTNFSGAARVWFMFVIFGHRNISVLDGGMAKWISEKRPLESKIQSYPESHFSAHKDENRIRNLNQILRNIETKSEQLVDARSRGRFLGTAPEPRPNIKSGHIPDSFNVPFNDLLNDDGTYKTKAEMKKCFEENGVDLSKPIIASCGSGITACVLLFALDQIGHKQNALYDGSWVEWGTQPDTPVEK